MLFVKTDRPHRIRPGSDQYWVSRQLLQMRQQVRSNSSPLADSADVSVPDQGNVLNLLKTHHAQQFSILLISPKHDTLIYFMLEFAAGHVWFPPTILRDYVVIGACTVIDDDPNQLKVGAPTPADHTNSASSSGISIRGRSGLDACRLQIAQQLRRVLNEIAGDELDHAMAAR
jgi:hypothetical protein